MNHKSIFGLAVAAAIGVSGAHGQKLQHDPEAGVTRDLGAETSGPKAEAADQTLGMAILWAQVNSDGTLARGSGVVASQRNFGGDYFVFFNRNLEGCVPAATIANPSPATLSWGTAQVSGPGGPDNNRIWVETQYPPGTFLDRPFSLSVFCGG